MMTEAEDAVLGDTGRVTRTMGMMGMKMMDILLRRREREERRLAEGQREAAAALADRRQAQREGAHELMKPALSQNWRDNAGDRDLALAFVYAEAYADQSPLAQVVHDQLSTHLQDRHGNVNDFVDQHVSDTDLERVPAPSGYLSPSQQRNLDAREQAALEAAERTGQQQERILSVAGEDIAETWAHQVDIVGRDRADQWLAENLDPDALAELTKWERWDEAERERDAADQEREAAGEAETEEEEAEHSEQAAEHEANAESLEEQGDMEHARVGQFRNQPDSKALQEQDPEAAEAVRTARPGRTQPAAQQVAENRKNPAQHRGDKSARRAARNDRDNDRGR